MADRTAIEWTDATWNPVKGCSRVSEGCRNCYAEVMAARFSDPGQWGHGLATRVTLPDGRTDHRWTGQTRFDPAALDQPLRWRKPRRIFVCSTADLFHETVSDDTLDQVFAVMALASQHTFQVLTKRPERAREYLARAKDRVIDIVCDRACDEDWPVLLVFPPEMIPPEAMLGQRVDVSRWPLPNVWLGTSAEDQATADARIPHLLNTPAAVRFLSAEPLLGPVDITKWLHDSTCGDWPGTCICSDPREDCLDWVIVGGESGPGARPMHPEWARSLRDQCIAAGVPFFFKQWGAFAPASVALPGDHLEADRDTMVKVGKGPAGRLLDGREWNDMPGARA